MATDPPKKRVVVCGGGVIGVCTAYFISKKGAAVTLIEQSSIAAAASGKAGRFLALDWCDGGPLSALARASFDLHRTLAEELNGKESYGYRRLDTLSLSVTESENPPRRRSNIPAWIDGPVKSPRSIGTTETTAQVHPRLFSRRLVEAAVAEYGVEVVIGKVKSVEVGGGGVAVAVEGGGGGGVVGGDAVVLALGPWTTMADGDKTHTEQATAKPLHPVYTVTNIQHKVRVLDGTKVTYTSWVKLFMLHAKGYDVLHHIDGTEPLADTYPDYASWVKIDSIVLQWIYGTLSDDLLVRILESDSNARTVWVRLQGVFLNNKGSRAANLEHAFTNHRLSACSSLEEYCTRLKEISEQLKDVDQPVTESRLVLQLARALPPEYAVTAALINQQSPTDNSAVCGYFATSSNLMAHWNVIKPDW